MTQVTRNRIKNILILLLIAGMAGVLAFALPVLRNGNEARELYIQQIQREVQDARKESDNLSRTAGADSAAILARIRCNLYSIRTINSLSSGSGGGSFLNEEQLTTVLNMIDRYLSFLTTGMDTGEYQTSLHTSLNELQEAASVLK